MIKSYSSREVIKLIEQDGWYLVKIVGSHHHFSHMTKKGKVTVPHPKKDLSKVVLKSIEKQSGITFK